MADAAPAPLDPAAMMRSKNFVVLLVFAVVVGAVVSLISWGFLELIHEIQQGVFTDLPKALGFDGAPWWWPLPVLGLAGLPVAYAIARLPGAGGDVPADGFALGDTQPNMLPGIALAALATIGLGLVLGPESPLIALGAGLATYAVQLTKRDAPPQLATVMAAAGAFAAISVIFGSPIIAAVLLIEATGLGGATLPLILLPGLLAAGVGSLIFIGLGSFTGLSTSAYQLAALHVPPFARPRLSDVGWTILLALIAAVVVFAIRRLGRGVARLVPPRPFVLVPAAGLIVAGLAIAFSQTTDKGVSEVLFSGQNALPGLVAHPGAWTLSALGVLIVCKGLAWALCLGSFRGGPTFPAMFLGAAGGIAASHLPGFALTPAIAVGMGVMVAAMLKLPLSAIIITSVLTITSTGGSLPLVILGVVVAYLATVWLERPTTATTEHTDGAPPVTAGGSAERAGEPQTG